MNIVLKKLRGSNILAYGDFEISLDGDNVYQLVGKNGSGKSSIPVILEEVLYNNNSRGIKKAKLVNRKTGVAGWWGEVTLEVAEATYVIHKVVKTSAKVTLTKDGEDISGHTATQTYLLIKEILGGLDFKTFSKLVYQSMESSLDFLKATDTARKKFLTSFLGLEKYAQIEAKLKEEDKDLASDIEAVSGKLKTVDNWIAASSKLKLVDENIEIPAVNYYLEEVAELDKLIDSVRVSNAEAVAHNKKVKESRDRVSKLHREQSILDKLLAKDIDEPVPFTQQKELTDYRKERSSVLANMEIAKKNFYFYKDAAELDKCKECGHELDIAEKAELREQYREEFNAFKARRDQLVEILRTLENQYESYTKSVKHIENVGAQKKVIEAFGDLDLDSGVEKPLQDLIPYTYQLADYAAKIKKQEEDALSLELARAKAQQSNEIFHQREAELVSKRELAKSLRDELNEYTNTKATLSVLLKAFGNKGIVGYKIESSIKIFEDLINKYLSVFTDGKFVLVFKLDSSKLQVVIYDDGDETDMASVSSGEAAKINISTLLAIRNLMGAVSKINMNVVFLDEVVSVLDEESMDTLISILIGEHDLNTFLVSHSFAHPLVTTLRVVKEGKISKIYG